MRSIRAYIVRVRKVDLDRERGATEKLKVGSVIHRELLMAAAQSGVVLGAPIRIGPGPYRHATPGPESRHVDRDAWRGRRELSSIRSGPTSPFPVPYPRPHP